MILIGAPINYGATITWYWPTLTQSWNPFVVFACVRLLVIIHFAINGAKMGRAISHVPPLLHPNPMYIYIHIVVQVTLNLIPIGYNRVET